MSNRSQNGSFVSMRHTCLVLLLSASGVHAHELLAADYQNMHRIACSAYLPRDVVPSASLHLCTSTQSGQTETYACQDVSSDSGMYRIYFKGGHHPKAIARVNASNEVTELVWREKQAGPRPACNLPAPAQLSAGTQFQGAGVCKDADDHSVPCSVFRERVPRIKIYHVYMTFYDPDGRGPIDTQHIYTGANQDAMPAELGYQIGLSLLKTRCCKQRGLKYIEQAYRLFPASKLYRATYQHYKAELYEHDHQTLSSN